jgi:hypothetical protein
MLTAEIRTIVLVALAGNRPYPLNTKFTAQQLERNHQEVARPHAVECMSDVAVNFPSGFRICPPAALRQIPVVDLYQRQL